MKNSAQKKPFVTTSRNLSIGKAAKMLGVSIDTLRNWEQNGRLVPLRTEAGSRRYRKSQIQKYLKSHPKLEKQTEEKVNSTPAWITYKQVSIQVNPKSHSAIAIFMQKTALLSIILMLTVIAFTEVITLGYLLSPTQTSSLFSKYSTAPQLTYIGRGSEVVLGIYTEANPSPQETIKKELAKQLQPLNKTAIKTLSLISPVTTMQLNEPLD